MNDLAENIQGFGVLFLNSGARLRMKGLRYLIEISKGFEISLQEEMWGWRDEIPH